VIQLKAGQFIPGLSGERVLTSSLAAAFGLTIEGQGLRCKRCGCYWGSKQKLGMKWLECPTHCNSRALELHTTSPARAPIGTPPRRIAGKGSPVKVR